MSRGKSALCDRENLLVFNKKNAGILPETLETLINIQLISLLNDYRLRIS